MVFRKRVGGKRRAGPKRMRRRVGGARASKRNPNNIGGPNTCKVIESLPSMSVGLNTANLFVKSGITGPRASAIAKEFGLYRIAKIIYTHKPLYDTYSSSFAGTGNYPVQVPTLYWKMNRYGDAPAAFDGDYMRALGAKPFRLDDKNVTFSYKPNILTAQDNVGAATTAGIKVTPWLSTDDRPQDSTFTLSTAEHYGHTLFIEGAGAGSANGPVCTLDITVIYEFKNPRLVPNTSNAAPLVTMNV